MKLVELIAMFETFQTKCTMENEDIDLMDDVTDVKLNTSSQDSYYHLTVVTNKNMYKHRVPKVDSSLLYELKNAVSSEFDKMFKNKKVKN